MLIAQKQLLTLLDELSKSVEELLLAAGAEFGEVENGGAGDGAAEDDGVVVGARETAVVALWMEDGPVVDEVAGGDALVVVFVLGESVDCFAVVGGTHAGGTGVDSFWVELVPDEVESANDVGIAMGDEE